MDSAGVVLLAFFVILGAVSTILSAAVITPSPHCEWNGKAYANGQQFQTTPCTHCRCHEGHVECVGTPCMPPECVDPTQDRDHCCPYCPNGKNCLAPDGTIIPAGQDVLVDSSSTCRCGEGAEFFMNKEAICSLVGPVQG